MPVPDRLIESYADMFKISNEEAQKQLEAVIQGIINGMRPMIMGMLDRLEATKNDSSNSVNK